MRLEKKIVLLTTISLCLILGINFIFPEYVASRTYFGGISRWTAGYGVFDENSTFYTFSFVSSPSEYNIETQNTSPFHPSGWFNLTIKVPFEIDRNWRRIGVSTIFSAGTYGGVQFFWTLRWRLYNSSRVAFSDSWSHFIIASADSPTALWKNIESNIGRDEKNSSVYIPGQWYYEVTLTVHNATLVFSALKYQNYYNLLLEVFQQTSLAIPTTLFLRSFFSVLTAGVTVALVLGLYIIKRKELRLQKQHAHKT